MSELLKLLSEFVEQVGGVDHPWAAEVWENSVAQALSLVESEESPRILGHALLLDERLDLPVEVVVSVYRRLIALGCDDARTQVCFARYLLLHGPEWDAEATFMLANSEHAARQAGLWDASHLGHYPVFYVDR